MNEAEACAHTHNTNAVSQRNDNSNKNLHLSFSSCFCPEASASPQSLFNLYPLFKEMLVHLPWLTKRSRRRNESALKIERFLNVSPARYLASDILYLISTPVILQSMILYYLKNLILDWFWKGTESELAANSTGEIARLPLWIWLALVSYVPSRNPRLTSRCRDQGRPSVAGLLVLHVAKATSLGYFSPAAQSTLRPVWQAHGNTIMWVNNF